jgi:homoserine O-acetyltransferase
MLVEKLVTPLPHPFVTESGFTLGQPEVAYEQYGLSDGPVILLCHGGLSSCHAAGKYAESDALAGWWDELVGPGKVFDTGRYRILAMNALGSNHGSTGPGSIDPATGRRYGPSFPQLTTRDQVRFIKAFLDHIGVYRLHVMAGPSMGSLHTLQMAAMYPELVNAAIAVATAGRMTASGMAMHHFMANALKADPGFADGWYDPAQPLAAMKLVWQVVRIYYTSEKLYQQFCFDAIPDGPGAQAKRAQATDQFLRAGTEVAVTAFDPNALITVVNAVNTHDLGDGAASYAEGVRKIDCPLLLLNVDTDQEFPPRCADELAQILNAKRPGQASVRLIESAWGHLGCVRESAQLDRHIRAWMAEHAL